MYAFGSLRTGSLKVSEGQRGTAGGVTTNGGEETGGGDLTPPGAIHGEEEQAHEEEPEVEPTGLLWEQAEEAEISSWDKGRRDEAANADADATDAGP
jgi:hypothetical protein